MPVAVVVWSKPACVQCVSTKRQLDKHGIPHIERALEAISRIDPDVLRELVALYESQSRPRRQILHNGRKPR